MAAGSDRDDPECLNEESDAKEVNVLPQLTRIVEAVNRLAPQELAESWDRVGLQVNRYESGISRVLVALDLNGPVIQEGREHQVDGFIIHHPFLFKPLTQIDPTEPSMQILANLIKNDQFVFVAHTNMDKAERGINQYLAEILGLTRIKVLEPAAVPTSKIVVFTPASHREAIREAMAAAGAGEIGDYRECSFESSGTGTFRPGSLSHPYVGQPDNLEAVAEVRLEMVVDQARVNRVLAAVYQNHPYEEPVVDVYSLMNRSRHGLGRIGDLEETIPLQTIWKLIKSKLRVETLKTSGEPEQMISRIAICSGSGGSLISQAIRQHADLYLTGELNYHDHWAAREAGLAVIEAGHWATESCFVSLIAEYLEETFDGDALHIIRSGVTGEPYQMV
ncbi:MAG TPA: Nif3-like dinuclear metal center hexameric protein [Bacillota bacterium]|nr:Nif3-like dinuclear metal center hexameric protein [Bacillota bacterium]